jgi:hypothetical protein
MDAVSNSDAAKLDHLIQRYDGLKTCSERANYEAHCQEVAELVSPRKVDFVGVRTPGDKRMTKVYDPTGIHANELLAAGLHGLATNPASKWFSLRMVGKKIPDPTGEEEEIDVGDLPHVRKYLSDAEGVMWQRIYQPGTNFTTALHEFYLDLGAFGTAIMFIGKRSNGGLLFETRPLAECVIAENMDGRVDTVMRTTEFTVRQMMQMAKSKDNPDGWDVSDRVKDLYNNRKFDDKIKVIHSVHPRKDSERDPNLKGPRNMPWASCYFEHEGGQKLEEGGFPEFPYLVARWSKYCGEVYGRSPAMTALPDIKMLQAMELSKIKLLQKAADPPLWLKDDGVVGGARTMPGGITYTRGNPNDGVMMQPVSLQGIQFLVEDENQVRQRIRVTFFADMLQQPEKVDMTATEYMQRVAERMRLLGPLIGRLEGEALGPMIERIFGMLSRDAGVMPIAPPEIQGQEFLVEYVSPIATAQKQMESNALVQVANVLAMMAGPELAPQILQKRLDPNKLVDYLWDLFNADPDLLVDDEEQENRGQMEQLMAMIPAGVSIADIIQKVTAGAKNLGGTAQALGKTQVEGGLDVQKLIGAATQGVQKSPAAKQAVQQLQGAGAIDAAAA